ncbi:beta-defensin 108B [Herpailurus yagouaroundi]|uniref:beta-defensin 108B n=1 Tax=Herpailurus yagouaroundi TaxID=1608482 RepID=UPI001AD74564|nr:beta-defensin 108B [Puma yagouaroundi]
MKGKYNGAENTVSPLSRSRPHPIIELGQARGKFKICEHPNGSCQEFCLEKEVHAGQCLNGLTCCLPVGNEPFIEPTTPKER